MTDVYFVKVTVYDYPKPAEACQLSSTHIYFSYKTSEVLVNPTNMSISFSKCSPAQNPKLNFHPPMSNFHLRTWGNQVITCAPVLVPTNMPLRVSACSPAQNAKPVVNRPTADFSPSIWGERFISYTPADEVIHDI